MNGLARRVERAERATGAGEGRGIMMVLDPDYTEADIGLAYDNAGLEPRENDEVVVIKMWSKHRSDPADPDSGPYPFAQIVDFGR